MIMRQPQSVTVLVFITVLIVLLLILTVMVHMRNRKLKSTLEEQMAEECISTEYRICDGSWHRMLFTVKKGMSLEM